MEEVTDVTETEAHQGTEKKPSERTEMKKAPTSGKEMHSEPEEKVIGLEIFISISSPHEGFSVNGDFTRCQIVISISKSHSAQKLCKI